MSSQARPGMIQLFISARKGGKPWCHLGGGGGVVVCLLGVFLAFENICSADKMLLHGYL